MDDRDAKTAELKARYERGELKVDPDTLAKKLIDAHTKSKAQENSASVDTTTSGA